MRLSRGRAVLGLALALWLWAPAARAQEAVRVASKIDTEGALLGSIYAALAPAVVGKDNRAALHDDHAHHDLHPIAR